MKRLTVFLLVIFVFLCLVQVGAALTYEGTLETTPTQVNALKPGDIVAVTGTIKLPPSGDQTFALDDTVELYTQLEKAKWDISIVINGVENPYQARGTSPNKRTILGMDLAYITTKYEVKIKFSETEGVVPASFNSGDIILFRALELDTSSDQVGPAVYKNGTVINPVALQTQLDNAKAKLATLKEDIDAKDALGVDITAARQKYNTASSTLETAAIKISSSPSEVNNLLTTATSTIDDANTALDQAWAQHSIDAAKVKIASVEGLIKEFTVNQSLKLSDPRLVPITNKFDLAVKSKNDAQIYFDQGKYDTTRSDASQALVYANDAWNLSLSLKTELGQGFSLPGLPNLGAFLPVLVVIVVVAIIAGVIIYRKKMHWDELG
ncbi:MAG: hypothetical protein LUQ32_04710 [Methanomicrobiales archaeon]|nr:hypothetical protein [Methanomicrobiales archaeon]